MSPYPEALLFLTLPRLGNFSRPIDFPLPQLLAVAEQDPLRPGGVRLEQLERVH